MQMRGLFKEFIRMKDYLMIDLDKENKLYIKPDFKCSRFIVYYGRICSDGVGRRFTTLKQLMTYDSMDDLEADIGGYLLYCEYDDEVIDDGSRNEKDL